MNRSRPVLSSINDMRIRMSTKAKVPSHYETLKVGQNCTQDDIKASYYELSKKYHPDVNQSTDAKRQFQSLSDAYEVLGSFAKRKQYDRDLLARGERATSTTRPTYEMEEDPYAAFYRSRMANYDPVKAHETRANFDFNAWTQAHYGQTLRRTLKDKRSKVIREQMRVMTHKEAEADKAAVLMITLAATVVLLGLMLQAKSMRDHYDRNLMAKKLSDNDRKP